MALKRVRVNRERQLRAPTSKLAANADQTTPPPDHKASTGTTQNQQSGNLLSFCLSSGSPQGPSDSEYAKFTYTMMGF